MIIWIWHPYVVLMLSYIVVNYIAAKPFNLNEAIAAEERQKQSLKTATQPKLPSETSEKFSLNKAFKLNSGKPKKLKTTENLLSQVKKISSLKYRKAFQIRSPLKPKKIKFRPFNTRNKRKNQSIKREIKDEKLIKKYIPLLKSISLLFDNILAEDTRDNYEVKRSKYKRQRPESNDNGCTCNNKLHREPENSETTKETIISTTPAVEVSTDESSTTETPAATTDSATYGDVSSRRQNKDISTIPPRNTDGTWGNDIRFSEGSSPTFHPSIEGNIPWDNRNSEHYTGSAEHKPSSKNYEEDPYSDSREYESGAGFGGGLRGIRNDTRSPVYRRGTHETDTAKSENPSEHIRGDINERKTENKFEIGRNQTESSGILQPVFRGDGRFLSKDSVSDKSRPIQPEKDYEEGIFNDTLNIAGHQRIAHRNGPFTKEIQKNHSNNATVISNQGLNNPIIMLQNTASHKAPFVTIFDGYSVARDKNGRNKLAEHSIRLHS